MKAICVTANRTLEVQDLPPPGAPAAGHLIVAIDSATITHGDTFFLTHPLPNGAMAGGRLGVYGANAAGTVIAIGRDVPAHYRGRQVAIYKTLAPSPETIGLWSETAQVPHQCCLILPDRVRPRDYSGSFGNVLTVHAFLSQIAAAGHQGLIVTAGTSATGLIAAALTRRHAIPAIFLVRSAAARDMLVGYGVEHVLNTAEDGFADRLRALAAALGTTAVFDGVGGALLGQIIPSLPLNAAIYVYGFLGAAMPTIFSSTSVMSQNLTIQRFTVLESPTVRDPATLATAKQAIEAIIADPLLRTRIGQEFRFDQIDQALAYDGPPGARAILVA